LAWSRPALPIRATWRDEGAQAGSYAVGFLGLEERKLLFHLARDVIAGAGAVVDAGSFCGASAACMAAGLAARQKPTNCKIHCFDQFIVDSDTMVKLFDEYGGGRTLKMGESFLPIFREAVADNISLIAVHSGDILKQRWDPKKEIELLFVDVAKTLRLSK
jgi:predicted O-methyltransferase YrrM